MRMSDLIEAAEEEVNLYFLQESDGVSSSPVRKKKGYKNAAQVNPNRHFAQPAQSRPQPKPASSSRRMERCPDGFERDDKGKCVKHGMVKSFVHKMKALFGKK